jgi:hypothetical protein
MCVCTYINIYIYLPGATRYQASNSTGVGYVKNNVSRTDAFSTVLRVRDAFATYMHVYTSAYATHASAYAVTN